MGISLKQALIFVPQTTNWLRKIVIGGLLLFLPLFAFIFPGIRRMIFDPFNGIAFSIYFTLSVIIYCVITGYFFKTVHNRIIHESDSLPEWKHITYYLYVGIKAHLGAFVFSLPFIVLTLIIFTFMPLIIGKEIIPYIAAAVALHIFYTVFFVMAALNFTIDFKIKSFFNVKKAYNRIKDNIANYIYLVLCCICVWLVSTIISLILISAQIFSIALPFFAFYVLLIYTDLFAQFEANKNEAPINEAKCVV